MQGVMLLYACSLSPAAVSLEKLDSSRAAEAAVQASLQAYRAELAATAPAAGLSAASPGSTAGTAGAACTSSGRARDVGGGESSTSVAADLTALLSFEIGGGNGLEPLALAARMGLPVVDADLMGRAFPEMQVRRGEVCG